MLLFVVLVITGVTLPSALARTLPSVSASLRVFGDPEGTEAWGGQQADQPARPLVQEGLCLALCPQLFCAEPVMYRRLRTGLRQAEGRWRLSFITGRTGANGGDFT